MAYEKKPNYPSYKKPGVYSSGSIKELGLNNDVLEKFSLGNWNSIVKDSKLLVANASEIDIDERGRPVQLAFDDDTFTTYNPNESIQSEIIDREMYTPLITFTVNIEDGTIRDIRSSENKKFHPNNNIDENGEFSNDDEFEYYVPFVNPLIDGKFTKRVGAPNRDEFQLYGYGENFYDIDDEQFPDQKRNYIGMKGLIPLQGGTHWWEVEQRQEQIEVLNHYCLTNEDQELSEILSSSLYQTPPSMPDNMHHRYRKFSYDQYQHAFKFYGLKSQYKISFDDGFGYIQPKSNDYVDKPERGPIDILLDDNLLEKYRNSFFVMEIESDSWTHKIYFPNIIGLKLKSTPFTSEDLSTDYPLISMYDKNDLIFPKPVKVPFQEFLPNWPEFGDPDEWNENNDSLGYDSESNPIPFVTQGFDTIRTFYNRNAILNNDNPEVWGRLGAPFFRPNEELLFGSLNNSTGYEKVDFIVDCLTDNTNVTPLYYDGESQLTLYNSTSYPLKVNLKILLKQNIDFENPLNVGEFDFSPSDLIYIQTVDTTESDASFVTFEDTQFYINQIANPNVEDSYYRYKVIQWGDEANQLTDEQFQNTYYFNIYDQDSYPNRNDYSFKKLGSDQTFEFEPIGQSGTVSTHVYNTPGIKNIKIVIIRLTRDGSIILQTYLVTKNIVINDGALLSQDFSIFGGTDFNFLPIKDNQAIIGGLDEDSNYNNSVSKIVKDDNFVEEDYLERVSSKDYIQKFSNGLLGKTPGQLDLSQTRVFTESKDIYDFIGGDKLEWINNGSGSLPLNSLATDIFIRDEKCVVDLNPANSEFTTIQNQMGTKEQGILIGDYRVNQPKDSRVQKQGVMQTPLLETDNDKQAF